MFTVKWARGALRKFLEVQSGACCLDPAPPGQESSESSQTFLTDHNLHHGTVLPAGTVDQVGYQRTTRLDLVERLMKGPC